MVETVKHGRGVLYIVWGTKADPVLQRSIDSLHRWHPELPVHVERLQVDDDWRAYNLKATMMEISPFEETLFLDADTVVLDDLSAAFDKAASHGLACTIADCPTTRRYLHDPQLKGRDITEYNTGVLFFTEKARPVFDRWRDLVSTVDSRIPVPLPDGARGVQPVADQASFALAVEQLDFNPHVLPVTWNFRPERQRGFFGPLHIWHGYQDVWSWILDVNTRYAENPDKIVVFHGYD